MSESIPIVPLSDTIDLHCFHPRDIKAVVCEFIDHAVASGYKQIEIIHGKGKSYNKYIVHSILANDNRIEKFFDKPGNWGTTIAIIKRDVK